MAAVVASDFLYNHGKTFAPSPLCLRAFTIYFRRKPASSGAGVASYDEAVAGAD
jgi:hypothetical protein